MSGCVYAVDVNDCNKQPTSIVLSRIRNEIKKMFYNEVRKDPL